MNNQYASNERETFGVLVTIMSKSGVTCVYGASDFKRIVSDGCERRGYTCSFAEVATPLKVSDDAKFIESVYIEPKAE